MNVFLVRIKLYRTIVTTFDVSVFDTPRGTFAGVGRITEGTARFASATGDVFTTGNVSADGQFYNSYDGRDLPAGLGS